MPIKKQINISYIAIHRFVFFLPKVKWKHNYKLKNFGQSSFWLLPSNISKPILQLIQHENKCSWYKCKLIHTNPPIDQKRRESSCFGLGGNTAYHDIQFLPAMNRIRFHVKFKNLILSVHWSIEVLFKTNNLSHCFSCFGRRSL